MHDTNSNNVNQPSEETIKSVKKILHHVCGLSASAALICIIVLSLSPFHEKIDILCDDMTTKSPDLAGNDEISDELTIYAFFVASTVMFSVLALLAGWGHHKLKSIGTPLSSVITDNSKSEESSVINMSTSTSYGAV